MKPGTITLFPPAARPAPPGRRLAAAAIDGMCIALIGWFLARPIMAAEDSLGLIGFSSIDTTAEALMALILPIWGAAWIYFLAEMAFSISLGKLVLGLKITSRSGAKAPGAARLGRWAAKSAILLIIPPFGLIDDPLPTAACLAASLTAGLGWLSILGRGRRALHDRLSGTSVFRLRDSGAAPVGP